MTFWDDIRNTRFKIRSNGYKFDTWLFQVFVFLLILGYYETAKQSNFDLDYYACIDPPTSSIDKFGFQVPLDKTSDTYGKCRNPFYNDVTAWKGEEYLYPGEYGVRPSTWLLKLVGLTLGGLAFVFIANHLIHNRRFKKGG